MLGLILNGLSGFISTVLWWALGISVAVFAFTLIAGRFKAVMVLPTTYAAIVGVRAISFIVAVVISLLKITAFVAFILTAKEKITKLEDEKTGLEKTVLLKDAEITRKNEQAKNVEASDNKTDKVYVNVYRDIEKLRTVPDLSIANRLALDLTTDYYKLDEVPNAPPAN